MNRAAPSPRRPPVGDTPTGPPAGRICGPAQLRPVALAIATLVAAGCGPGARGAAALPARGPEAALALPGLDGGTVDLGAERGRLVVVHVFTTWSLAAQADVAELQRVRDRRPGRLALVGVGLDPDGAVLIAPWRDGAGVDYPIALPGPIAAGETPFGAVRAVPVTFVLDRAGRLAWRHDGPLPHGLLEQVVRNLETEGGGP